MILRRAASQIAGMRQRGKAALRRQNRNGTFYPTRDSSQCDLFAYLEEYCNRQ